MMRMSLPRFILLTTLGSLVWNLLLVGAGYALGSRWEDVSERGRTVLRPDAGGGRPGRGRGSYTCWSGAVKPPLADRELAAGVDPAVTERTLRFAKEGDVSAVTDMHRDNNRDRPRRSLPRSGSPPSASLRKRKPTARKSPQAAPARPVATWSSSSRPGRSSPSRATSPRSWTGGHGQGVGRPRPRPREEGPRCRHRRRRSRRPTKSSPSRRRWSPSSRPPRRTRTRSGSRPTSTVRARPSHGTSQRRSGLANGKMDERVSRVVFSEITPEAMEEAFSHPRGIDSGPRRRVAGASRPRPDRRVPLSPLLWRKVRPRSVGGTRPVADAATRRRP